MNLEEIMNFLYDHEINFLLSSFWDGGYTAKLGDEMNGFTAQSFGHDTPLKAMKWLLDCAYRRYPSLEMKDTTDV